MAIALWIIFYLVGAWISYKIAKLVTIAEYESSPEKEMHPQEWSAIMMRFIISLLSWFTAFGMIIALCSMKVSNKRIWKQKGPKWL